jgi:hypothetical protein
MGTVATSKVHDAVEQIMGRLRANGDFVNTFHKRSDGHSIAEAGKGAAE